MTVNLLFTLNLLTAAALGYVMWRMDKVRFLVTFHLLGLVVAGSLYAAMTWLSAVTEMPQGHIPFKFIVRVVVVGLLYVPFLVFLVVTYVRVLGGMADGGVLTVGMKVEDATTALRLGHEGRAVKIVTEVLEKDPDNVDARTLRGEILLKHGKYEKAVGSFRLAMANAHSDAEFAKLVFRVALILNEHLGDVHGATRELDLIRKRMPDTPEAKKAQEWIVRIMDEDAREG